MIYGLGTDIIEISRIKKIIKKHNDSFLKRVFTQNEIFIGKKHKEPYTFYAGRWAAKEAFAKALGTGIGEHCNWTDIEIMNNQNGKPICSVSGKAEKVIKNSKISKIHISISHEKDYATSTVILEEK